LRRAVEVVHTRTPWTAIDTPAKCRLLVKEDSPYEFVFGEGSANYLAPFALNLFGCLAFEPPVALPLEDAAIVVERDLGPRSRWFGNHVGGTWPSDHYRSFLVRDKVSGSHQVVSLAILAGMKTVNDPVFGNTSGMTYLCVAVD